MKSRNFEFLRSTHPQLAEYGALAEHHLEADSASSLVKMRMFAEHVVGDLYQRWRLPTVVGRDGREPDLHDLLNAPKFVQVVPRPVRDALHRMRLNGKRGCHHGYPTDRDAAIASLKSAHDTGRWFSMTFDLGPHPDAFDESSLRSDIETKKQLKRDREEALREKSRLLGEMRDLRAKLTAAADVEQALAEQIRFGQQIARVLDLPEREPSDGEREEAEEELAASCKRAVALAETGLPNVIVPAAFGGEEGFARVVQKLAEGKSVALVGEAGLGKSLLALHATKRLASDGRLVLFARARYFEGKLEPWLDSAAGPLSRYSAATLLQMSSTLNACPILVVDGWNECPRQHQSELTAAIQALLLRDVVTVLFTMQEAPSFPFDCETHLVANYSDREKEEVFNVHAHGRALDPRVMRALSTPYEVSLAARCTLALREGATAYDVLGAYVRTTIAAGDVDAVFQLLLAVARELSEKLKFALPISTLLRRSNGSDERLQALLAGPLLHVEEGFVSFRHELLQEYFVAESLLRSASSPDDLARLLELPRHHSTVKMVLQAVAADGEAIGLFQRSGVARSAIVDTLLGSHGGTLKATVQQEIGRVVSLAIAALDQTTIEVIDRPSLMKLDIEADDLEPPRKPRMQLELVHARAWSAYEQALLGALGSIVLLPSGLAIARPLIEATDKRLAGLAQFRELRFGRVIDQAYGPAQPNRLPASMVLNGATSWSSARAVSDESVSSLAHDAISLSPGILWLSLVGTREVLSSKWQPSGSSEGAAELASCVAGLVRAAWNHDSYYLRLRALELVVSAVGSATSETQRELSELVGGLDTDGNIFLNTALIEALDRLGLVEPPDDVDEIAARIAAVLAAPASAEAREAAYSVFSNQFEEVIGEPFFAAVSNLGSRQRTKLLSMAALGAEAGGFFLDMCLAEAIECLEPEAEPLVREAIEKWSNPPELNTAFVDNATGAFAFANIGRAVLELGPTTLRGPASDRDAAWNSLGEILYWTAVRNLTSEERKLRAANAWRFVLANPEAALAPLYWIEKQRRFAIGSRRSDWFGLSACWPSEVRALLERAVTKLDSLRPAYAFPDRYVRDFVVATLAELAGAEARCFLEPLVDRSDVGPLVVDLIKRLERNRAGSAADR